MTTPTEITPWLYARISEEGGSIGLAEDPNEGPWVEVCFDELDPLIEFLNANREEIEA